MTLNENTLQYAEDLIEYRRLFHNLVPKYRRVRMLLSVKLSDEFLSCIKSRKHAELGPLIVLKIEPAMLRARCSADTGLLQIFNKSL